MVLENLVKKIVNQAIDRYGMIAVYENDELLDEITAEIYQIDSIATYEQIDDLVVEEVYKMYSQVA